MDRYSLKNILEKEPCGTIERYRVEKGLSDKFGPDAVKVYLLIDGKTPAEEVMRKADLAEQKFVEIMTYMEEKGIVKTEEKRGVLTDAMAKIAPPQPLKEEVAPIPMLKTEETGSEKVSALEALIEKTKPPEKPGESKPEEKPAQAAQEQPKPAPVLRTPLEKKLYEKFGNEGLDAYFMIDEFKTPKDILRETKMSEEQLIRILEFMNNEGIIRLEKPQEAMEKPILKAPAPQVQQKPEKSVAAPQPPKPVGKPVPQPIVKVAFNKEEIYIPTISPLNLLTKLRIEADLLKRYGNDCVKAFSMMNGKRTNVKIIKDTKINPAKLDDAMTFLAEKGVMKLQPLTPESIKELYGEEGSGIYGKYRRDGILLYELIDKKATLKDIVKISGIEPRLAVEIFSFIHKVLGLEIPLDTELLYKQLGVKPQK